MKDLFTIGEVARLFEMNIRTLRYYDEIGLLKPEHVDGATGYRYYSTRQFERLNTIRYMRALDMPLAQIAHFFAHREVDTVLSLFKEQRERVREKQELLGRIGKKIDARISQLEDAMQTVYDSISVKEFPRREVAVLKKAIPVAADLEVPIRDLDSRNELADAIFLGKVGVSVSRADLLERRFDGFSSVFVVLEEGDTFEGEIKELPAGPYITVRFQGTHQESAGYYIRLLDELGREGYAVAGDSVEITLIDSGITGQLDKYVTELQIPVAGGDGPPGHVMNRQGM